MSVTASALEHAKDHLRRGATTRIAVVGASNDPRKYGNIIVKDLQRRGYRIFPVNLHEPVDIVDVVTPPEVTKRILKEAAAAGLPLVWLQDGSFDDAVLAQAEAAPFATVAHACIMVVAREVVA